MKYEGKFAGVDVYSDKDCPPGRIYFINGKIQVHPRTHLATEELKRQIRKMIRDCKILIIEGEKK